MSKLSQTQVGQVFEYAVVKAGQLVLGEDNLLLEPSARLVTAQNLFQSLDLSDQLDAEVAARMAFQKIIEFEPHLEDALNGQAKVWLKFNSSKSDPFSKRHVDARDILIGSPHSEWEVGIVAKHRHEALRNSRLSQKIDFGLEWLGISCSDQYFQNIAPIFKRLENLKKQNVEWNSLIDKNESVYLPLLAAFREELIHLDYENPMMVAPALIKYLIGNFDYYRVIQHTTTVNVDVFNFNGTLNLASNREPSSHLRKLTLPSKLLDIDFAKHEKKPMLTSSTTLHLKCDGGWEVSFRLHNASKLVEPSLKFDIKLIQIPDTLQSFKLER